MNNHKRILIFTGGVLGAWALEEVREQDLLVGVERGALFLLEHNLIPHLLLGDFDSVTPQELSLLTEKCPQIITCDPVEKDYTDTDLAFQWALDQQPSEIVVLGALGSRFDHTLANIQLLNKGLERGVDCKILDANNEIRIVERNIVLRKGHFSYVSLIPFSPKVTGITLRGFRYPLNKAILKAGESLGVSNLLEEREGSIEVETGYLLVIQSKD